MHIIEMKSTDYSQEKPRKKQIIFGYRRLCDSVTQLVNPPVIMAGGLIMGAGDRGGPSWPSGRNPPHCRSEASAVAASSVWARAAAGGSQTRRQARRQNYRSRRSSCRWRCLGMCLVGRKAAVCIPGPPPGSGPEQTQHQDRRIHNQECHRRIQNIQTN